MITVKSGTLWSAPNGKRFRVINIVDLEGHIWVHYREDFLLKESSVEEPREYSCYQESFVSRFAKLPE